MELKIIFQLFLAVLLGALIGFEREWKRKSAGLQTYSLVALGSCIFTIASFQFLNILSDEEINFDPTRIIQAVATGIGFIGAGVIFFRKDRVEGLTTAAGLWATAAIGVAVGANFYFLAFVSTFLALVVLAGFGFLERKIIDKKLNKNKTDISDFNPSSPTEIPKRSLDKTSKTRAHVFVFGIVQGVFFRAETQRKAWELGIFGWVRNTENRGVEMVFEGDKEKVEKIIDWARRGPPAARVEKTDVVWEEYKGEFKNFEIR